MENDELKHQIKEINLNLAAMERAIADQQTIALEAMALQSAHFAALRILLVRMGEDRTMLGQRIESSYKVALKMYQDRLESFYESGQGNFPRDFPILPDETLGN